MLNTSTTRPVKPPIVVILAILTITCGLCGLDGLTASPAAADPVRITVTAQGPSSQASSDRDGWHAEAASGLKASGPPELFGPDTLYEIINGDADLYLKAGFSRLETRRFNLKADPGDEISVFIYEMKRHRSAFAVYSVRRAEEARPVALTRFAYRYRDGLFLVHGPYYLEILAADESAPMLAAMNDLAAAFIADHAVEAEPIVELDLFPPEGLVPGSLALHPANAFGFDGFADLFTARYRLNTGSATAFFKPSASPQAAADLAAAYQDFLTQYDGVAAPGDPSFPEGRLIRVMDAYTLVFVHGQTVAGVQDAGTPELAARLARALKNRLTTEERK